MKQEKIQSIYERVYDNPFLKDGNKKPNKRLGDFVIIETLKEDMYNSTVIGRRLEDGKIYLITENEVSGMNGGSKFEITLIHNLKINYA